MLFVCIVGIIKQSLTIWAALVSAGYIAAAAVWAAFFMCGRCGGLNSLCGLYRTRLNSDRCVFGANLCISVLS